MRICLINNLYSPYVLGGTEVYLDALIKYLSMEHQICLITTIPFRGLGSLTPKFEESGNVRIFRFYPLNVYHLYDRSRSVIPKAIWYLSDIYNIHTCRTVRQVLREEKPSLVHTHNLRGLSMAVWDAVKTEGLPLVHTLHDYHLISRNSMLLHGKNAQLCDGNDLECKIYRSLMRRLVDNKPDFVISPSRFVLDKHLEAGFFVSSRKAVLPLWGDPPISEYLSTSEEGCHLRALYIGTISRHKGVRYLVLAFRRLIDKEASLEIIGSGDQELDECRRLAANDSRIHFRGFMSGKEKEAVLNWANVIVLPSVWYDNAPLVILESFARGKPVIASRIGGIPELVEHEKNGLLFEPRNINELVVCLEKLGRDHNLLEKLSKNAIKTALRLSAEAHVISLLKIYQSVCKS